MLYLRHRTTYTKGKILKLNEGNNKVEVVGSTGSSNFSIAMNGKAFRVLSDTLYQNKIGSIVREISCNAYDAHVMAGKPEAPFEIHLPDAFEPWFSVKDYGIGLTREAIQTVFTKYFESTKDSSNDVIGAFGLGAKTPFSYTDQFTITSIVNNEKIVYSAYIGESGVPCVDEMMSSATNEPNGVEINLSVKRDDYRNFANEVRTQLRFFKVKPIIKNGSVTFDLFDVEASGDGYIVYRDGYGAKGTFIVQGNVGYPLSLTNLQSKISTDEYNFAVEFARGNTILEFNIGEIGVTASREAIEYDDNTCKNIEVRLKKVREQMKVALDEKAKEFTNEWDRHAYLNSMSALQKNIYGVNNIHNYFSIKNVMYKDVVREDGSIDKVTDVYLEVSSRYSKKPKYSRSVDVRIVPTNQIRFIIKDITVNQTKRLNQFYENNSTVSAVYILTALDNNHQALKDKLSKALGGCTSIMMMSDIVLPKAVRKNYSRTGPTVKYMKYEDGSFVKMFDKLVELKDEVLYKEVGRLSDNPRGYEDFDHYELINALSDNDVPDLVLVRSSDLNKIKDKPNFKPLAEYVKNESVKFDTTEVRKNFVRNRLYTQHIGYVVSSNLRNLLDDVDKFGLDTDVQIFWKKLKENYEKTNEVDNRVYLLLNYYQNVELNQKVLKMKEKLERKFAKFTKKYPVLKWASSYNSPITSEEFKDTLSAFALLYKDFKIEV